MTKEDKELLLKDLCTRLPYYPKCKRDDGAVFTLSPMVHDLTKILGHFKHYLRSMSSMTEVEKSKYLMTFTKITPYESDECIYVPAHMTYDWLNKNHFDYRGLIEKDLALEAPEGMYDQ